MFEEFQEAVITTYREKKENGTLPSELERPSPARLRLYCLTLLNKGVKDDTPTLTKIFNPDNRHPDLETGIRKFEVDKLRPLRNFMMGRTANPREDMVKLLAIMIDFQPRPYDKWRDKKIGKLTEDELPPLSEEKGDLTSSNEKEENRKGKIVDSGGNGMDDKDPDQGGGATGVPGSVDSSPRSRWLIIYGIITAAAICLGIYFFRIDDKQCMYWSGDRYEPILCTDTTVRNKIALDESLLRNMRKITTPDTLTEKDLGNTWYVKITVDSIEFYTSDGFHPIYDEKKMRPMTKYILKKYVLDKQQQ